MSGVVHIAGIDLRVNNQLRQRCAWCGAVLIDYALDRVAAPVGQDPTPATWQAGDLIEIDGNCATVLPYVAGDPLPTHSCGLLDPEVTG